MSIQLTRLANGLQVVTEAMPGLASTALGVWIGAGARNETCEQNGVAHFLEHMAFKGTGQRSALQIAEQIEDVGGYLNAYTSRETTAYYARVLPGDTLLALDILADILRNPLFAEEEIAVERGVILQEIGQALDTPDDVVFDWLQEVSYPDQPMGRTILGPAERVAAFGRADLERFVAGQYGPARMILSASGAVDHDAIVAAAERLFGDMTPGVSLAPEPAVYRGGERRARKALEQAHFALGMEGPHYLADDVYAAQIYATLLGGGMSSRLFQEIREKRGLCYTIFAQAGACSDSGALTVYAGTGGEEVAGLAELVIDEMKRAAEGASAAEVNRARAQFKAGMLMGLESPFSRCERNARTLAIHGRAVSAQETVARIEAVDVAAARAAGAAILSAGRLSLALYGQIDDAPGVAALAARLAA